MSRVRAQGIGAFRSSPDFAWSGWRLRIPGGPEGGQYHGYIAPDSSQSWEGGQGGWPGGRSEIAEGPQRRPSGHSILPGQGTSKGPWAQEWGGTSFDEGENHSDYVYRASPEMRPRPNASGGQNVIFGYQDEATAGYAEAPGNYRGLGNLAMLPTDGSLMPVDPRMPVKYPVSILQAGIWPAPKPAPVVYARPVQYLGPPDYQPLRIPTDGYGATNVVPQPPVSQGPYPQSIVPWSPAPVSPAPSPTVAASPTDYLPSQGQVIDGLTPGTPSAPSAAPTDFTSWLAASTIIPGVANQWIALAAVAAFLTLNSGKGKR